MMIRVFPCRECGHLMRLGSSRCGQCGCPSPALNWTITHIAAVALLVTVSGAALVLILR